MRKRRVNQELFDLLRSGRWNDFTVANLKAAYVALPNCPHRTDKAAWQFVYRNVVRMESRGLISRVSGREGDKVHYRWNMGSSDVVTTGTPETDFASENMTTSCLKEKLHRYKIDILTAIGETEEYDSVCKELPHMRDDVQMLYNEARDRCSKILGRVKALESILANCVSTSP